MLFISNCKSHLNCYKLNGSRNNFNTQLIHLDKACGDEHIFLNVAFYLHEVVNGIILFLLFKMMKNINAKIQIFKQYIIHFSVIVIYVRTSRQRRRVERIS